jgi:hypothetical protein
VQHGLPLSRVEVGEVAVWRGNSHATDASGARFRTRSTSTCGRRPASRSG